jgi:NAD(P) transhydrogenase subunit alpha
MLLGVPNETYPGERRVALTPQVVTPLTSAGVDVVVERGAGVDAGFADQSFQDKGARLGSRDDVFDADIVVQVRTLGANPEAGRSDLGHVRERQALIGFANPVVAAESAAELARCGVRLFAVELMPRITRAQGMDALSSQATISGYKAVILAARALPKMFPMLTTAAGTVTPARVFVIGAGVAGLQAIATARRLGAVVEAYDVRPAVKEQVESLGAKFVELPLETSEAEDRGGYAKAQDEDFYRRQRELMGRVIAASDAVITTALVPGKKAPVLVTEEMVAGMSPGSVVVDIAAEQGGNCELTQPDREREKDGVLIVGPTNLPATVPHHASQMYAKNVSNFVLHLARDGALQLDLDDEITRETLVTEGGEVVHPRVREALGLTVEREPAEPAPTGRDG